MQQEGDAFVRQVRIHGRGGQGVVTASELLSVAAFNEGKYAQAFPSFGSERTGAPVVAFCRIDTQPLRSREPVSAPDAVVVQDSTLLHQIDVFSGLAADGFVLINSERSFSELGLDQLPQAELVGHALTLPATALAMEHVGKNVPNVVMLAGLSAITGWVALDAIVEAIRERFSGRLAAGNVAAARAAHAHLVHQLEVSGAHAN